MAVEADLIHLVQRARAGDAHAWEELTRRFRGLIAAITRSFRIPPGDAEDIAQTTWLRLFESIDRIREPERLAAWIGTTARRECLRFLRSAGREQPSGDIGAFEESRTFAEPGEDLMRAEAHATVRAAVHALPGRHRELMSVMLDSPVPSYAGVADVLDMPIGSIGPSRIRALESLRRNPRVLALAS